MNQNLNGKWISRLIVLACVFRLIAAKTNIGWGHPDEWFQTVEYGGYLAYGIASQSIEFLLHMRNLTWPTLLTLPLKLSQWLDPESVALRVYLIKLMTATLDLSVLWGFSRLLARERGLTPAWKTGAWVLFVLPWFTIGESVRPSQEHLSALTFWAALGFLAAPGERRLPAILGGVVLVLTGAFRYPSFTFTAGACLGLLYGLTRRELRPSLVAKAPWVTFGLLCGFLLGGLADWIHYGRPWESFWMYTQYNVFTGLSASGFGVQPASTYLEYFKGTLGGMLFPLGIAAVVFAPIGTAIALRRGEVWAWGLTVYLVAHCLIGHKEPRFMAPSLMLVVWATWKGARAFHARYGASWGLRTRRILGAIAVITLILNGALVLRSLWGETWKVNSNFLQSGALLVRHPSTCAILSIRRPVMGMLPWNSAETAPDPAVAFMPTSREQSSLTNRADIPLLWIGEAPHCAGEDDTVLVQPRKPENAWETEFGCELLSTGPLAWVSGNLRAKFLENNWVSAPWYSCPARVIQAFPKQEVRTVIARRMRKLPSLPPFGVSGDEFLKQAWGNLDPVDPANRDATFGDW